MEVIVTILKLRWIVSFLSEKSPSPWWNSDIFGSSSLYMFRDIFNNSSVLAQYHAAKSSAMYFHDKSLSKETFHLFRLKEELEQDLHSYVLENQTEQKNYIPKSVEDGISNLKSISNKILEKKEGPFLINLENNELNLSTINKFSDTYLMAFNNKIISLPYIMNNE